MSLIIDCLVDFLYPKKCAGCGKVGVFLCRECLESLEYSEQICPECGKLSKIGWTHDRCLKRNGMDGLITVYSYEDEKLRKIIDEIKFGFNRELIKEIVGSCDFSSDLIFDMVVPIPLYFYRENWRGFNQARDIAGLVAGQLKMPVADALKRVKNTKQQSMVDDKKTRERNVRDAFRLKDGVSLNKTKVLLVDDVFTSGSSMKEATFVLKQAGARIVWGVCLAH